MGEFCMTDSNMIYDNVNLSVRTVEVLFIALQIIVTGFQYTGGVGENITT